MDATAFDLAGCCVGIVERDRMIDGRAVREGDAIVGLASNGLHANGFSLVRALVAQWDIDLARPYQEQLHLTLGPDAAAVAMAAEPEHALATVGEVLLAPTRIYARAVLGLRNHLDARGQELRGVAHITGGGLHGNVARALPAELGARLDPARWRAPSVMRLFGALGGLQDDELRATFNGGLGMVVVVATEAVDTAIGWLSTEGIDAQLVGRVVPVREPDGARYAEGPLV
jgi:phosphoribosylformylglycinamidine cyclo-ligase